jgi:hypothetical protein
MQSELKVFGQFYNSIKNYKLSRKNMKLILFEAYMYNFFHTLSTL